MIVPCCVKEEPFGSQAADSVPLFRLLSRKPKPAKQLSSGRGGLDNSDVRFPCDFEQFETRYLSLRRFGTSNDRLIMCLFCVWSVSLVAVSIYSQTSISRCVL